MPSIRELLADASGLPGDSPALDAQLLLSHSLGRPRSYLYGWPEAEVAITACRQYQQGLEARRQGQPLAYLLGRREFWSLNLRVDEHTLIPRPDTEVLVQWALELALSGQARVADLGTGCGAIALALASERPGWQVTATDVSAAALQMAQRNAGELGLGNVSWVRSDWLEDAGAERFDLIVSNPPYICRDDPHLQQGDLRFEPAVALASGSDGLNAIRAIIAAAPGCLQPGSYLLLEHGYQQAAAVRDLLAQAGFKQLQTRVDLAGHERVSGGLW